MAKNGTGAIVGLGITEMGKIYGRTATDFAAEAIALALDDAGLRKNEVDGLLINGNLSQRDEPELAARVGLRGSHAAQRDECLWVHGGDDDPVRVHRDRRGASQRRGAALRRRAAPASHVGRRLLRHIAEPSWHGRAC